MTRTLGLYVIPELSEIEVGILGWRAQKLTSGQGGIICFGPILVVDVEKVRYVVEVDYQRGGKTIFTGVQA